jgi:putative endonuclease
MGLALQEHGIGTVRTPAVLPPVARRTSRTQASRRASCRFGDEAEQSVANFLRAGGFTVLARRARQVSGEIDLVAVRDDTVAFVEVKARSHGWDGLDAVGRKKQARLSRARDEWLAANPVFADFNHRFDIALVWKGGRIEYLENAFEGVEAQDFVF